MKTMLHRVKSSSTFKNPVNDWFCSHTANGSHHRRSSSKYFLQGQFDRYNSDTSDSPGLSKIESGYPLKIDLSDKGYFSFGRPEALDIPLDRDPPFMWGIPALKRPPFATMRWYNKNNPAYKEYTNEPNSFDTGDLPTFNNGQRRFKFSDIDAGQMIKLPPLDPYYCEKSQRYKYREHVKEDYPDFRLEL